MVSVCLRWRTCPCSAHRRKMEAHVVISSLGTVCRYEMDPHARLIPRPNSKDDTYRQKGNQEASGLGTVGPQRPPWPAPLSSRASHTWQRCHLLMEQDTRAEAVSLAFCRAATCSSGPPSSNSCIPSSAPHYAFTQPLLGHLELSARVLGQCLHKGSRTFSVQCTTLGTLSSLCPRVLTWGWIVWGLSDMKRGLRLGVPSSKLALSK